VTRSPVFGRAGATTLYAFEGVTHRFAVSGVILVKPSEIEIAANLLWLVTPFKARIEAVIRERLKTVLG
jgi:hypothetical protein